MNYTYIFSNQGRLPRTPRARIWLRQLSLFMRAGAYSNRPSDSSANLKGEPVAIDLELR